VKIWVKVWIITIFLMVIFFILALVIATTFQMMDQLSGFLTYFAALTVIPSAIIGYLLNVEQQRELEGLNAQKQRELEERKMKYAAKLESFNKIIDTYCGLTSLTNQKYSVEILKDKLVTSNNLTKDEREILVCLLTTARDVERDLGSTIINDWIEINKDILNAVYVPSNPKKDAITFAGALNALSLLFLRKYQILANRSQQTTSESFLVFDDPKPVQGAINEYLLYLARTWKIMPFPNGEKPEINNDGRNIGLDKRYAEIINAMRKDLGLTMFIRIDRPESVVP